MPPLRQFDFPLTLPGCCGPTSSPGTGAGVADGGIGPTSGLLLGGATGVPPGAGGPAGGAAGAGGAPGGCGPASAPDVPRYCGGCAWGLPGGATGLPGVVA